MFNKTIDWFYSFLLFLILYMFVNNPILKITGNVGLIKFLYPIAIIALLWQKKIVETIYNFRIEIFIYLLLIFFSITSSLISGEFLFPRFYLVGLFENIFLSNFIFYAFFASNKFDFNTSLINVGIVGAIISLICLINIPFNLELRSIQTEDDFISQQTFRNFGFSSGLSYSYGLTQAVILILMSFKIKERPVFILFIPIIAISILINARTGFLVVLLYLLYNIISKVKLKLLTSIFLITVIISIIISKIEFAPEFEQTVEWAIDFFKQVGDIFTSTKNSESDTTGILFKDMLVLPTDFGEWVIGSGKNIFGQNNNDSDVGFLIQLKYGGVALILLLLSMVLVMSYRLYLVKKYSWFLPLTLIIFLIGNIKGNYIPYSGIFRLVFFMYVFIINSNLMSEKSKLVEKL